MLTSTGWRFGSDRLSIDLAALGREPRDLVVWFWHGFGCFDATHVGAHRCQRSMQRICAADFHLLLLPAPDEESDRIGSHLIELSCARIIPQLDAAHL